MGPVEIFVGGLPNHQTTPINTTNMSKKRHTKEAQIKAIRDHEAGRSQAEAAVGAIAVVVPQPVAHGDVDVVVVVEPPSVGELPAEAGVVAFDDPVLPGAAGVVEKTKLPCTDLTSVFTNGDPFRKVLNRIRSVTAGKIKELIVLESDTWLDCHRKTYVQMSYGLFTTCDSVRLPGVRGRKSHSF